MAQLTDLETRILEFAEQRANGSKESTVEVFGWSATAYVMRLHELVARPDVEANQRWTILVHRLRKVAGERAAVRVRRTFSAAS